MVLDKGGGLDIFAAYIKNLGKIDLTILATPRNKEEMEFRDPTHLGGARFDDPPPESCSRIHYTLAYDVLQ